MPARLESTRAVMRWLMAAFYGGAGVLHVTSPEGFLPIMPDWIPAPREVVIATGACELLGALGLLVPATRRAAGVALAVYAVCVFPANIKHAVYNVPVEGLPRSWWYHGPRLAMQPVLAWWPLFASGVTRWPFRAAPTSKP